MHDQRMRDRLLARDGQPFRVPALQHGAGVGLAEPARVGEFGGVEHDLGRLGPRDAAEHEGVRERPRLARMVADLPDLDARLLQHLAPHGMLDVLARLDEAGERRVHLVAVPVFVSEEAAFAVRDEHDHDRVRTREPLETAGPAFAPPATVLHERGAAAVPAAAGVLVPLGERTGLPAQRQLLRRHGPLHGERAQVDDGT